MLLMMLEAICVAVVLSTAVSEAKAAGGSGFGAFGAYAIAVVVGLLVGLLARFAMRAGVGYLGERGVAEGRGMWALFPFFVCVYLWVVFSSLVGARLTSELLARL